MSVKLDDIDSHYLHYGVLHRSRDCARPAVIEQLHEKFQKALVMFCCKQVAVHTICTATNETWGLMDTSCKYVHRQWFNIT